MKNLFYIFLVSLGFSFLVSCSSSDYNMIEGKRESQFYSQFFNASEEAPSASQRIEKMKLLQTNEDFPIRLVLFEGGKFYYQVDELGSGYGDWAYREGGLRLTAKRKVFDMNFFVSAAAAQGDELVVKFFDRHGLNSFPLQIRDPGKIEQEGGSVEKLREFKSSVKDI